MSNLSIREAAARLGVSDVTLRRYVREHQIASLKIGRRRLVKPEALDAFEKQRAVLTDAKQK
jgi:excisionase family DNA binding protein